MSSKILKSSGSRVGIIYEDKDILVLNKPSGLAVHGDGRTKEKTLVDWLLKKYPKIASVGEQLIRADGTEIARPGIVHRLDRDTSGVMIVAKSQDAYEFLKKHFQKHKIKKTYTALVYDNFHEDEGVIDRPIGKHPTNFRLRSALGRTKGVLRPAKTYWKVLERFPSRGEWGSDVTLLALKPVTGRTHQIRAHLVAISHPVVCDPLYAAGKFCPPTLGRLALHASEIAFSYPWDTPRQFSAPLPLPFVAILEELRRL